MAQRTDRRKFLKSTAALGVGYWVAGGVSPRPSRAANQRLAFACVGIGGKGQSDSIDAGRHGDVVAICDIDGQRLDNAARRFTSAKKYFDFRKMLEEMGKSIDAVTVSTPDHTHAVASVMAMRMKKHCFTQKPLTHSIYEARILGEIAKEMDVITQMGNQGTAQYALRKSAALIQKGALGNVQEVHVWTNRPVWPQGEPRPATADPIPSHVHWKEWISRAPYRDYNEGIYHPFKWRGWWDFGTGALGDMACHTLNMPFMALNLRDPVSVQATTTGHNKDYYPAKSVIDFEFPAIGDRAAVRMTWYDGGNRPSSDLYPSRSELHALVKYASRRDQERFADQDRWAAEYRKKTQSSALIVGEKGSLYSPGDYGQDTDYVCLNLGDGWVRQEDISAPSVELPQLKNHFTEFADAIASDEQATSNFPNYAGPLTETILLGNLAVYAADQPHVKGPAINWDAANMKVLDGSSELAQIVKPECQNGYTLDYQA